MSKNDTETTTKRNGISANRMMIPIIIILLILHIGIIFLIVSINTTSTSLSETMKKTGTYTEDATGLLGGSSVLSETATSFVLRPLTESGELNISPLAAYASELKNDRRGPQVEERFQHYDVSDEEKSLIADAASCASMMMEAQLHALSLLDSIYHIPNTPALKGIPLQPLSAKEQAMSKAERIKTARQLVLGTEYNLNKQTVSQSVNTCVQSIRHDVGESSAIASRQIAILRIALWICTIMIILILVLTFLSLYSQVFVPLGKFTRMIPEDKELDAETGVREVRLLASAYNGVKNRRDALDAILRSAASTDALTNLPNRFGFEQFLLDIRESDSSVALLLFDVNYLKRTNDTQGHAAGDRLLQASANCITDCFEDETHANCFRFGGDEFAAILRGKTRENVEERIRDFAAQQKKRKISIAWGMSYTEHMGSTTAKYMIDEADRRMYQQKKRMHIMDRDTFALSPDREAYSE
jgi:diguanylate cyclase (GGDEF)-like protein